MKTWLSQPVARNLLRTTFYLIIVSGLSVFILASIVSLTRIQETGNPVFIFLVMMVGASVGGGLWARSVIQSIAPVIARRSALTSGITFGILVFLAGYSLELVEQVLFRSNRLNAPGVHIQFVGLFSAAIFLVAGITATVMTARIVNIKQAGLYGAITAFISVIAFIGVDLVMYLFGWRVGHIDFPERPTMTTVMGLGLLASALTGGTTIGVLIERTFSRAHAAGVE
jgi:hypothetical protein